MPGGLYRGIYYATIIIMVIKIINLQRKSVIREHSRIGILCTCLTCTRSLETTFLPLIKLRLGYIEGLSV